MIWKVHEYKAKLWIWIIAAQPKFDSVSFFPPDTEKILYLFIHHLILPERRDKEDRCINVCACIHFVVVEDLFFDPAPSAGVASGRDEQQETEEMEKKRAGPKKKATVLLGGEKAS